MSSTTKKITKEVIVLGGGISGVVTAKCMREAGFDVLVLEQTSDVGGLWTFRENAYGVMKFTHINVSKHNYCFSDFPFPEDTEDFPHNVTMANYVRDYVKHFSVDKDIEFHIKVNSVKQEGDDWVVYAEQVKEDGQGVITCTGQQLIYTCKFLAVATGHHAKPTYPNFPGQDSFTGKAYHSIDYQEAHSAGILGKKVVIVGIGNSAIDAAINAATVGMCKPVHMSTRSGAWIVPNYIFGHPVDYYASRMFLGLPWRLAAWVFETVITIIQGHPKKWGLNPKMHVLQTQPSVSPVLIHHIQRGEIKIVPNISRIEGQKVYFTDDTSIEADHLIYCTGYKIDVPFLPENIQQLVLEDESNSIKLFKNVFCPDIGHSLAFIGFVQPASGGVLTMSETQARWWAELCRARIRLPSTSNMEAIMKKEMDYVRSRWFHSRRHTIQRDPIIYNDEIASYFGAKPKVMDNLSLGFRLLLGSGGAYRWRLQGPGAWSRAAEHVRKVPVPGFIVFLLFLVLFIIMVVSHVSIVVYQLLQ